jgi:hypothetical protein
MNTIKFSFDYLKLPPHWEGKTAFLVKVETSFFDLLPSTLVLKDTVYYDGEQIKYYPLPKKGECLILKFVVYGSEYESFDGKHVSVLKEFATIRRSYPSKKEYYSRLVGKEFVLKRAI